MDDLMVFVDPDFDEDAPVIDATSEQWQILQQNARKVEVREILFFILQSRTRLGNRIWIDG